MTCMITVDLLGYLTLHDSSAHDSSVQVGGGTYYMSHRREFLDVAGEWYLDEVRQLPAQFAPF